MKHYDRLIFVSKSDTAMGPMAEAILEKKYLLEELVILSRGMVVLFPEPINAKAQAVLISNDLNMQDHMSQPLTKEDFEKRTLVLAITEEVKRKIISDLGVAEDQVYTLNEYTGDSLEIKDPYGGSLIDYGICYQQLDALITKLVVRLNEEELLDK